MSSDKEKRYDRYLDDNKFRYLVDVMIRSTIEDKVNLNDWEDAIKYLRESTYFN